MMLAIKRTANPSLTITTSNNTYQNTLIIEGTASDATPDSIYSNNTAWTWNNTYINWKFTNNTNIAEGTYHILITANDSAGNTKSSLFNFTYDSTAPTVTVLSSAGTSTTASSTTISGNATDNAGGSGIASVTVNGATATLNALTGAYSKSVSLSVGSNQITVIAYDNASNSITNTSVSVTRTAVTTPGGSSSGGGSVSYTSISEQGTSITLRKGFIKTFTVNKAYHTMKGIKLGTDYITFQITSTPVTVTLKLLESKKFDFDNDGYYDLYVKLDEIKNNQAYLTLKQIHEPITAEAEEQPEEQPETPEEQPEEQPETPEEQPEEQPEETPEEEPTAKNLAWLWILVVLIIIGLAAYFFIYKKKY